MADLPPFKDRGLGANVNDRDFLTNVRVPLQEYYSRREYGISSGDAMSSFNKLWIVCRWRQAFDMAPLPPNTIPAQVSVADPSDASDKMGHDNSTTVGQHPPPTTRASSPMPEEPSHSVKAHSNEVGGSLESKTDTTRDPAPPAPRNTLDASSNTVKEKTDASSEVQVLDTAKLICAWMNDKGYSDKILLADLVDLAQTQEQRRKTRVKPEGEIGPILTKLEIVTQVWYRKRKVA
ncbi:hypothetical protein E8E11_004038 [Didymella keratinophila]|nr:hypothetical protein E8E11_004038 [Didymella keratinophila]